MEQIQKVAAINDLSGYGKCSLTVAIPILSVFGLQCCPLPTAILSNHTGYESFFFDDYTDKMKAFFLEWKKLDLRFDCIYTGFLGSERQIDLVQEFLRIFRKQAMLLVDPVMGDEGIIYSTYSEAMCEKMKRLVSVADLITPNVTEACILSGEVYQKELEVDKIRQIAVQLHKMGAKQIVITGIRQGMQIQNYVFDGENGEFVGTPSVPYQYSGTGDVFASVLCGYMLSGQKLLPAVRKSAEFVYRATKYSHELYAEKRNGILFEKFLKEGFFQNEQ